jgi:hypothetical protein
VLLSLLLSLSERWLSSRTILRRIAEIDKYLAGSGMDYLIAFVVKSIGEADRGQSSKPEVTTDQGASVL